MPHNQNCEIDTTTSKDSVLKLPKDFPKYSQMVSHPMAFSRMDTQIGHFDCRPKHMFEESVAFPYERIPYVINEGKIT